jgi:hypothetical protein
VTKKKKTEKKIQKKKQKKKKKKNKIKKKKKKKKKKKNSHVSDLTRPSSGNILTAVVQNSYFTIPDMLHMWRNWRVQCRLKMCAKHSCYAVN